MANTKTPHKHRVALFKSGDDAWTVTEEESSGGSSRDALDFLRYLTDWIEVEV
jgi:hypothetical protein